MNSDLSIKRLKISMAILSLLLIVVTFAGCIKEKPVFVNPSVKEKGIKLTATVLSAHLPSARGMTAAQEQEVNTLDVLVFDNSVNPAALVDHKTFSGAELSNTGADWTFRLSDILKSTNIVLVLVANAETEVSDAIQALGGIISKPKKQQVLAKLEITCTDKWAVDGSEPIPMYGEETFTGDIYDAKGVNIPIVRMLAKVDVINEATAAFVLEAVHVINYNQNGFIAPMWETNGVMSVNNAPQLPNLPSDPNMNVWTVDGDQLTYTPDITAQKLENEIYLMESWGGYGSPSKVTRLVLEGIWNGTTYFYPVDFTNLTGDYIPILRNYRYILTITEASGAGYKTFDEAVKAFTVLSNLKTRIIYYDEGKIRDIVFNGQYMLGSNELTVILKDAQDFSIPMYTDNPGGWTATINPHTDLWLNTAALTNTSSGTVGNGTLDLRAALNTGAIRAASINLTAGRLNMTITVIQLPDATIPDDPPPANVTMYVGAFWKANQSGERLIRIPRPATTAIDGPWMAAVIEGNDWIVLDKQPSSDTKVWTAGGPARSGNDANFDIDYKVSGTQTLIRGNMRPTADPAYRQGDDYIYFRIGLTGEYTPTGVDPARYGVVLLVYTSGGQLRVQRIWIRQGEDTDFLMRPNDWAPNGAVVLRTRAVKFSPYNSSPTNNAWNADVGIRGGDFTKYPTQAGGIFQWAGAATPNNRSRYAWDPFSVSVTGWQSANESGFWNTLTNTQEVCPPYYRRPNDGTMTALNPNGGPATDSEMRQSLWLNPSTGAGGIHGNPDNSVFGYYADGFFDRREINNGQGTSAGSNSTVSVSNGEIAHIGRLFYNPFNNASLFFPAAGIRSGSNGALSNSGMNGEYWSATLSSDNTTGNHQPWYLFGSASSASMGNTGVANSGRSLRCVSCVPISHVTVTGPPNAHVGDSIRLVATTTPLSSPGDGLVYVWEYIDGPNTYHIGVTTTNEFDTKVLRIGTTEYKVTIQGGCNSVESTVTVVIGENPLHEPEPNILMYVGAFWRADQTGERVIHIPVGTADKENDGFWFAYVNYLDNQWGPDDGVILTTTTPDRSPYVIRTNNPGNAETYQVPGNETFISGFAPANGAIDFRIGLQKKFTAYNANTNPARYAVVIILYGDGEKFRRIFIRQGEGADYMMRPGTLDPGVGIPNRTQAVKFSPYNLKDIQHRIPANTGTHFFGNSNKAALVDYPTMIGYLFSYNYNGGTATGQTFFGSPAINGLSGIQPINVQWSVQAWWSPNAPMEVCPTGYRRPNDGVTNGAGAATFSASEIRQSLWLNPQNGGNSELSLTNYTGSNHDNSVGGTYADGYYDRGIINTGSSGAGRNSVFWNYNTAGNYFTGTYPPANLPGGITVTGFNPLWMFTATSGRMFYNPTTNASLFFPAGGVTTSEGQLDITGIGERGGYWTSTAYSLRSGNTPGIASYFDFNIVETQSGTSIPRVRMNAAKGVNHMTIRCVQNP